MSRKQRVKNNKSVVFVQLFHDVEAITKTITRLLLFAMPHHDFGHCFSTARPLSNDKNPTCRCKNLETIRKGQVQKLHERKRAKTKVRTFGLCKISSIGFFRFSLPGSQHYYDNIDQYDPEEVLAVMKKELDKRRQRICMLSAPNHKYLLSNHEKLPRPDGSLLTDLTQVLSPLVSYVQDMWQKDTHNKRRIPW